MKKNAKQFPKCYYARHIEQGLVGYDEGVLLVRNDTLKKMNATFAGKPVYVLHQEVDLENLEKEMDGVVSESFYNELDGCHYLKFIAIKDELHQKIQEGWSVSNAYNPVLSGVSGVYHNIAYQDEAIDGEYTHLAIVPDPRYEGAKIFSPDEFKAYNESKKKELEELKNSKGSKIMFKLFKRQEVNEGVELDTIVQLENGKEVTVKDMVTAIENAEKEKEKEKEKKKADMDMVVNVDGKDMPVKELVSAYKKLYEEEEDKKKENQEEEEKDEKEKEVKEKEARENSRGKEHFDKMENAIKEGEKPEIVEYETTDTKLARGKERY